MRRLRNANGVLALTAVVLLQCLTVACQDKASLAELERCRRQAALEEQNRAIVRRIFDELNRRNDGVYQELYAPEYGWHFPSNNSKAQNREEEAKLVRRLWTGFPDIRWEVQDVIADDDTVVARFVARGTHTGVYEGLPPAGNTVEVGGVWTGRIKNGKVVEAREEGDVLGWMQQLGMELKPKQSQKK